jgi:hypothetical protein
MDELALVARLRDDVPGIDLTSPHRQLADEILAEATVIRDGAGDATGTGTRGAATQHGKRGTRGMRGYGPRLVVAGTVAAAVAAAVVLVVTRPAQHPSPPRSAPPSTTQPGSAGAEPQAGLIPANANPRPAASAAQLVAYTTRAAAGASAFNPKPNYWVYTKTLTATSSAGEGGMLFGPPDGKAVSQGWTRVDGREVAFLQNGKLVISPGGGEPGGWPNVSYPYLDSLPSSPAKLKAVIEAGLKAQNYVVGSGNIGVFNAIQALIENVVLPIKLRASLYGVLANDPAVHFDPRVTDFAGQTGVAFYTYQEGYLKVEIVINPRTYAYLGERYVAYRARNLPAAVDNGVPSGPYTHVKQGQITGEDAVLASGIVRHAGQVLP